jgi:hypothetical protein
MSNRKNERREKPMTIFLKRIACCYRAAIHAWRENEPARELERSEAGHRARLEHVAAVERHQGIATALRAAGAPDEDLEYYLASGEDYIF